MPDTDDVGEVAVIDSREYALIIMIGMDGEATIRGNVDKATAAKLIHHLAAAYPLSSGE